MNTAPTCKPILSTLRSTLTASSVPTDLSPDTRKQLIKLLGKWHFEPHKLSEEKVLACTLILFEGLYRIEGMEEAIGVSLSAYILFLKMRF